MPRPWRTLTCAICERDWQTRKPTAETCSPKCRAALREQRTPTKGSKPRNYPAGIVELVRYLYCTKGMTVAEVGRAIPRGFKAQLILERYEIPRRGYGKRDQFGERNHMWKGDDARYDALHLRVEHRRGKPHECEWCGTTEGRFDWANLTGDYLDVDDYARLCVPCHRKYDAARRRLTGRPTIPPTVRR